MKDISQRIRKFVYPKRVDSVQQCCILRWFFEMGTGAAPSRMSKEITILDVSHCHAVFEKVLTLRSRVYRQPILDTADEVDPHSTIHVAIHKGMVAGSLRVTFFADGSVCCQEFMPDDLISKFSHVLGSASRFCVDPDVQCEGIAVRLIRHAWRSAIDRGKFIDIIDVREEVTRYYERFGYRLLAGAPFVHPRLGTRSRLMICTAHPTTDGSLCDIFASVDGGVPMSAILPWLERTTTRCVG